MTYTYRSRQSGFTLIELAVVLALIALIINGGLAYTAALREEQRRELTLGRLENITQALEAFVEENGYIPCPADPTLTFADTNFGFGVWSLSSEDPRVDVTECNSGNVVDFAGGSGQNILYGAVPVYSLNIPPDNIYDGWNRRFTYIVDEDMTFAVGYAGNDGDIEIRSPGFDNGAGGDDHPITYRHATQQDVTDLELNCEGNITALGDCIRVGAPVAVLSHGSNGFGSYAAAGGSAPLAGSRFDATAGSDDEDQNADHLTGTLNETLIQSLERGDFDDFLAFRLKWQLEQAR